MTGLGAHLMLLVSVWARRDPDLSLLHGHPKFEELYPESGSGG